MGDRAAADQAVPSVPQRRVVGRGHGVDAALPELGDLGLGERVVGAGTAA